MRDFPCLRKGLFSTEVLNASFLRTIRRTFSFIVIISGAHSEVETHVPFPNTVVKDLSGDGTANLTVGE